MDEKRVGRRDCKGACTYYVCTGRGEGGSPKAYDSTDKLRECHSDKGGGGQKIPKFCGRHKWKSPYVTTECERQMRAQLSAQNPSPLPHVVGNNEWAGRRTEKEEEEGACPECVNTA